MQIQDENWIRTQMQQEKRIRILRFAAGVIAVIGVITILFLKGEKLLPDGWYYIPDRAIMITLLLCIFWQGALIAGACFLMIYIKKKFNGWMKHFIKAITVVVTIVLVLLLAGNWIAYNFKLEEKVKQCDEHIAIYVCNTFARTRFRYPHYMYEENWLLMRNLSEEEMNEAVWQYGNPDDYYNYE